MILKINNKDVSNMVGSISLNSSIDTLGEQLDFEISYSDMYYYPKIQINTGDIVQMFEADKEIFLGIIVVKTRNESSQAFSCFDFAFYLNKSKVIKQFNGVRADMAIKSLLSEFDVPLGKVTNMAVIIKKIYYDKEVSEVIKDILKEVTDATGLKFVMEMNQGKFYIYQDSELTVELKVKIAENLPAVDINRTISSASKKASIEGLRNSVKLYVGNDEKVKVVTEVKNDALIEKYGLIQETKCLEDKDIAQARNIAQNMLKELGRVLEEGSISVLGHFDLRAGRILTVNEPITNLVGRYKIKSAKHSIGSIHTTDLELEGI